MTKEQFNHEMERIAAQDWSITRTAVTQVTLCMRYIASLEAENANLNDWLTAWKESLTIAQAEIAKLEKQLKSQIELHETWHVTYRIKLDYIDELENKLKRSGLL